jgi:HEAT repeat protein
MQALAARKIEAIPELTRILKESPSVEARRNALWTATRIDADGARKVVRLALSDEDQSVRQVALHSISLWRDQGALATVLKMLSGPYAHNRRAAAEALGRIGDKSAVPALLETIGALPILADGEPDRALEHSLIFALIEIGDPDGTAAGLKSPFLQTRRAALIALDQMENGKLQQ